MPLNETPTRRIVRIKARAYSCLFSGAMLHVFLAESRPQASMLDLHQATPAGRPTILQSSLPNSLHNGACCYAVDELFS